MGAGAILAGGALLTEANFGRKDKGAGRPSRSSRLSQQERDAEILSKSRKTLGLDPGEKIGGGKLGATQASTKRKKDQNQVKSILNKAGPEPEIKRKTLPGEENLTKKSLLGV